ncbi:hypothetical protein Tco_1140457, partial [Tanacetum coccineum]
ELSNYEDGSRKLKVFLESVNVQRARRCGYCKNHKKTVNTGKTRTRERKSMQRAGRKLSKVKSGQLKSTFGQLKVKRHQAILLVDTQEESYVDSEESTRELIICSNSLTKQAHKCHITDCHVGNPCAHTCDLTVDREYPMIGFDLRAKKRESV